MRPSIYHMTFDRSVETRRDVRFEKRRARTNKNNYLLSFVINYDTINVKQFDCIHPSGCASKFFNHDL